MIDILKKNINRSLERFMDRVKEDYKFHLVNPVLYDSLREFSLRDGKRIRPLLLILSYMGYCGKNKRISPSLYNASTCMEMLHNFMLIHDDIIDRSALRRGKPTLHKLLGRTVKTADKEKLGYDLGIIAGDIVYALAIDAFLSIQEAPERKEKALRYFIQTAAFTAMGEFIDTVYGVEKLDKVKEKDVFLNYTLKTARYTFDCPLVVGALLAGAGPRDISLLSHLGLLIGQAFQIQDDIIGIFGSQKKIGKSILSDLAESKKTLLVCHAYRKLRGQKRALFVKLFTKPAKTYRDLLAIRKIFIHSGSLQYCLGEVKSRFETTLKILGRLKMNDKYRGIIKSAIFPLFKHSNAVAQKHRIDIRIGGLG
ncbi:MAG: polyprenyl synthetase family protein [Candidatus Omnitrophica bacterium]|nr:polyprenyl synthetase family protein [Candidatus Omnitrophota bacterium]